MRHVSIPVTPVRRIICVENGISHDLRMILPDLKICESIPEGGAIGAVA